MTAAVDLLAEVARDGLEVLAVADRIKLRGDPERCALWAQRLMPHKAEILEHLRRSAANTALVSRWIIGMPDSTEIDVVFCPAIDETEVRARYPEALAVRPAPLPADLPEPEEKAALIASAPQLYLLLHAEHTEDLPF